LKKIIPAVFVILIGFWVQPAMAYIDPGSGSAIMTAIVGLFIAIGLSIKTYWYKLKSLFTSKASDPEVEVNQGSEDRE
jgi:hypothetical protein